MATISAGNRKSTSCSNCRYRKVSLIIKEEERRDNESEPGEGFLFIELDLRSTFLLILLSFLCFSLLLVAILSNINSLLCAKLDARSFSQSPATRLRPLTANQVRCDRRDRLAAAGAPDDSVEVKCSQCASANIPCAFPTKAPKVRTKQAS